MRGWMLCVYVDPSSPHVRCPGFFSMVRILILCVYMDPSSPHFRHPGFFSTIRNAAFFLKLFSDALFSCAFTWIRRRHTCHRRGTVPSFSGFLFDNYSVPPVAFIFGSFRNRLVFSCVLTWIRRRHCGAFIGIRPVSFSDPSHLAM